MLEVKNLFKKYKGAKDYSIKNITFTIPNGKVLGLLGKNGAGKSTTIKSICGIFPFDKGTIKINGFDMVKQSAKAKAKLGYSPDDHSTYEKLTGRECLNYTGSMYGMNKKKKAERIPMLAKLFGIDYALDAKISSYSHGMHQKICLCISLLHEPSLWVLDEPMLGLDPQTKVTVLNFIRDYAKKGNCILFSSHDIYTVSKVCDYVAIINKGEVVDYIDLKHTKYDTPEKLEDHFLTITGIKAKKVEKKSTKKVTKKVKKTTKKSKK